MEAIPFSIESYDKLVCTDKTHIVKTRSERRVDIYTTKHRSLRDVSMVVGAVDFAVIKWFDDGRYDLNNPGHQLDLVIVPKPPVSLGWVAVLLRHGDVKDVSVLYPDKEALLATVGARMLSEPIEIFAKP